MLVAELLVCIDGSIVDYSALIRDHLCSVQCTVIKPTVGIFNGNPRFHPTDMIWNRTLTQVFQPMSSFCGFTGPGNFYVTFVYCTAVESHYIKIKWGMSGVDYSNLFMYTFYGFLRNIISFSNTVFPQKNTLGAETDT